MATVYDNGNMVPFLLPLLFMLNPIVWDSLNDTDVKTTSSDDPLIQPNSSTRPRRHIDMPSMQPAEFLNVNYTLSLLDVRQFKEAERKGYNKETPEFAGFQTGQNTRDIHFKRLGYTATTTEFAHLRFRFNVSDTILMAKQVSEAANHYLHSMRGKR